MKLARTFESAEAFRAQWPRSVDALLRLNEGPLVLPDDRRTAARTAIWATRDQPEVARIGLALSKLWAFDERFFGDVIGGGVTGRAIEALRRHPDLRGVALA